MSETYQPDGQFVDRLEWQLASEYRRTNRLKPSPGKIAVSRKVMAMTLVAGILVTGVAMTKAADFIKDSWRKKIEIARAETEIQVKEAHLAATGEMESRAKMRYSNGLIREEEYMTARLASESAALDLKRSRLNLDEVRMSGVGPRDELYSPLVGGRDFVSERLQLEIKQIDLYLELLKTHTERVKQLVEENMVQEGEMDHIQADITAQTVITEKIQKRLDLRKRFLDGEFTAREVEIKDRMIGAERSLQLAQSNVDSLKQQLKRLETLQTQGMTSQTEIQQLQYALEAAQAELRLATLEIEVLEQIK